MLQSNPRQGVKEMTVACPNHVSSIEFSEFGEKNGQFWPISNAVIPPWLEWLCALLILKYSLTSTLISWYYEKKFCNLSLHSLIVQFRASEYKVDGG